MAIRKFRKKPVVIEAIQWDGTNGAEIKAWGAGFNLVPAGEAFSVQSGLPITAEVWVNANDQWLGLVTGEWVIRDNLGFYPCKPDIFAETYEAVNNPYPRMHY
ncbi:hypothetical protein [Mycobacteroides abscessus]|uniref:hypothetical protein n=1 Tax=Mycobacteroides abscessus TaxID=36809 RepID=UPI000C25C596|nr:hypothetical protein [Mycobacteroides abscessus]